jgi:hypothetical protein
MSLSNAPTRNCSSRPLVDRHVAWPPRTAAHLSARTPATSLPLTKLNKSAVIRWQADRNHVPQCHLLPFSRDVPPPVSCIKRSPPAATRILLFKTYLLRHFTKFMTLAAVRVGSDRGIHTITQHGDEHITVNNTSRLGDSQASTAKYLRLGIYRAHSRDLHDFRSKKAGHYRRCAFRVVAHDHTTAKL